MHTAYIVMQLHSLFGLLILIGVVLFVLWANKNLGKKELKSLWKHLLIIGIVGCLLTSFVTKKGRWHDKELSAEKKAMIMEVLDNNDVDMTEEQLDAVYGDIREKMKGMKRGRWGRK